MNVAVLHNTALGQKDAMTPLPQEVVNVNHGRFLRTETDYVYEPLGVVPTLRNSKPRYDGKKHPRKEIDSSTLIELILSPDEAGASTFNDDEVISAALAYAAAHSPDCHQLTRTVAFIRMVQRGASFPIERVNAFLVTPGRDGSIAA